MLDKIRASYDRNGIGGVVRATLRRVVPKWRPTVEQGIRHATSTNPLDGTLEWLSQRSSFSIVQIGAYIGVSETDPICHFLLKEFGEGGKHATNSTVILVEPVKEYYDELRRNYAGLNLKFENVAIAETSGVRDLYRLSVRPETYGHPAWLSELSSLRSDRMTTLWDRYEKSQEPKEFYLAHRLVEKVRCMTLLELLTSTSVART